LAPISRRRAAPGAALEISTRARSDPTVPQLLELVAAAVRSRADVLRELVREAVDVELERLTRELVEAELERRRLVPARCCLFSKQTSQARGTWSPQAHAPALAS
jgi:hypothetical protein